MPIILYRYKTSEELIIYVYTFLYVKISNENIMKSNWGDTCISLIQKKFYSFYSKYQ